VLKGISDERVRTDELGLAASVWEGWAVQDGKETNFPQMSDEISNGRAAAACPSCGRGSMAFTIYGSQAMDLTIHAAHHDSGEFLYTQQN